MEPKIIKEEAAEKEAVNYNIDAPSSVRTRACKSESFKIFTIFVFSISKNLTYDLCKHEHVGCAAMMFDG